MSARSTERRLEQAHSLQHDSFQSSEVRPATVSMKLNDVRRLNPTAPRLERSPLSLDNVSFDGMSRRADHSVRPEQEALSEEKPLQLHFPRA